jgi:hypothetical protein
VPSALRYKLEVAVEEAGTGLLVAGLKLPEPSPT